VSACPRSHARSRLPHYRPNAPIDEETRRANRNRQGPFAESRWFEQHAAQGDFSRGSARRFRLTEKDLKGGKIRREENRMRPNAPAPTSAASTATPPCAYAKRSQRFDARPMRETFKKSGTVRAIASPSRRLPRRFTEEPGGPCASIKSHRKEAYADARSCLHQDILLSNISPYRTALPPIKCLSGHQRQPVRSMCGRTSPHVGKKRAISRCKLQLPILVCPPVLVIPFRHVENNGTSLDTPSFARPIQNIK